jgi:hypothetical protein
MVLLELLVPGVPDIFMVVEGPGEVQLELAP